MRESTALSVNESTLQCFRHAVIVFVQVTDVNKKGANVAIFSKRRYLDTIQLKTFESYRYFQ